MTKINKYLALFGGLFLLVFIGFFDFIDDMKSANLISPKAVKTLLLDANGAVIVVLTGGSGRIATGLTLLKKNPKNIMIISGVNENAGMSSIFANYDLGDLKGRIYLEKKSKSTFENAEEAVEMVETLSVLRGVKTESITLVTSPYHMYRASYTFNKIFPKNISVITYPTEERDSFQENWFSGMGVVSAFKEYVKMYVYYIKLFFR